MLNTVIIQARLGHTPELKQTNKGQFVTTFSVCCERDGNRAVMQKPQDWFSVVCYDKLAENLVRYCDKGSEVIITGRLQERGYTDIYGNDKKLIEINARAIQFIGEKKRKDQGKDGDPDARGRGVQGFEASDDESELPF